jgi:hypothetical protein
MCTIENTAKLCKGTLEALSVVMGPLERSCGREEWVSTILRAHQQKSNVPHSPGAGVRGSAQRQAHPARRTPYPAALLDLRPARQAAEEGAEVLGEELPEGRASEPGAVGGWRALRPHSEEEDTALWDGLFKAAEQELKIREQDIPADFVPARQKRRSGSPPWSGV